MFAKWKHAALFLADVVICAVVVLNVPYTEIDWEAYMTQVTTFLSGERDYKELRGSTGPLVYPAGFVYIYSALYAVTERGENIVAAQWIFVGVYLATVGVVLWIYARLNIPFRLTVLLVLSKRLHSIFMLRMFNDCVVMWFVYFSVAMLVYGATTRPKSLPLPSSGRHVTTTPAVVGGSSGGISAPPPTARAIMHHQEGWTATAVYVYCLACSIKMNALLFAPAVIVVMAKTLRLGTFFGVAAQCILMQIALGWPFLMHNAHSYITKAFELSRVFDYTWTVNFRFLPDWLFVSSSWGLCLLCCNLVLWWLMYRYHWRHRKYIALHSTTLIEAGTNLVLTLFESNLIGIACARTLHYQFYAWFFHQVPLVLYAAGTPIPLIPLVWLMLEVGFNVYPSRPWSSAAVQVALWFTVLSMFVRRDRNKKNRSQ